MPNMIPRIETIPTNPPPNGSIYSLIIKIIKAHSFPFTNCIAIPVFSPNLPSVSDTLIEVISNLNIAIAIAPKKAIPIQCRAIRASLFSLNESTANPTANPIMDNPIAIPAIREMLLFFPNKPLWAKEVNAFGPGVINAILIISNNSSMAVVASIAKRPYHDR